MHQTSVVNIQTLTSEDFAEGFENMSQQRREKCNAYRSEKDKKLCIAADIAIKSLLSEISGMPTQRINITKTPEGKPICNIDGCYISISHSEDFVFVGAADTQIGIDIEKIRPISVSVTRRFCSANELNALFGCVDIKNSPVTALTGEKLNLLFAIWTFKEAYYKCYGFPDDFRKTDFFANRKLSEIRNGYALCTVLQ